MVLRDVRRGGPGRDRTCDLGIKSPLLYQLSYRPRRLSVDLPRPRYVILKTPFIPAAACPGTVHLYG